MDTIYSDNGSTFCAAGDGLPDLLKSTEFHDSLRKCNVNWVRIPPNAPSLGGSGEIMVKLFKVALNKTIANTRLIPSLIELQTFVADTVRIVNDRPLTTVSDQLHYLSPITPSFFLGQHLSPNTLLCGTMTKETFEIIFCTKLFSGTSFLAELDEIIPSFPSRS